MARCCRRPWRAPRTAGCASSSIGQPPRCFPGARSSRKGSPRSSAMEIGFVGLGRMGGNMVTRLIRGGHQVVAYDRSTAAVQAVAGGGARGVGSLGELVKALAPPRPVWVMVPAGEPTETTIQELAGALEAGDIVIDGGNTHYKDDVRRARARRARAHLRRRRHQRGHLGARERLLPD